MRADDRDERIATRAAEIALARLAAALANPAAAEYTSHRAGPRPEGYGLRRWQKLCPSLPGARRRGRYWVISVLDFDRWEAAQHETKPAPPRLSTPTDLAAFAASLGRRAGGAK